MMTPEQISASHKATVETLFGLTAKAFEGVEKMVELNLSAAKPLWTNLPTTPKPL